jgi:hypothetical protein
MGGSRGDQEGGGEVVGGGVGREGRGVGSLGEERGRGGGGRGRGRGVRRGSGDGGGGEG